MKPIVHYVPHKDLDVIVEGQRAIVEVTDHPFCNKGVVSTSKVVSYNKLFKVFETENTRYVPVS